MHGWIQYFNHKKILITIILILILCIPLISTQASENSKIKEKDKNQKVIDGEYIVKLKDWGDDNSRSLIFDSETKIHAKNEKIKSVKVSVSERSRDNFLQNIRKQKNVLWAEPNYVIEVQLTPNDPSWNQQWGPKKIASTNAWDLEIGSQEVLVAVIDTGIYYTHPDLIANYISGGYDWVNDDNDPKDDHGHGTHCAGIIAATINNGKGIAGLAQVKIMSEKFLNSEGSGTSWDAAQAITHAIDFGATISNRVILSNSWGSSASSNIVREAMEYAYQNGALIVAAAGNDASSAPFYPASYPEVISVSATDSNDNLASFSNYGSTVELSAPGVSIYSTYLDNGYKSLSGTSMATPHVAGVAALTWSHNPNYNRDLLRILLQIKADDLGAVGWDKYYGYGRINAYRTVQGSDDHDIRVAKIVTPPLIFPNNPIQIQTTIQNVGINSEFNLEVQLLIDGTITETHDIAEINIGESVEIQFEWSPTSIGTYNISVYALPIPEETLTTNNMIQESASVQETRNILLVSDDDADYYSSMGTSLNSIKSVLTKYGYTFSLWSESEYGRPTLNTLENFRVVIWTCGDYWHWAVDPTDAENLIQYISNGGTIILEGEDIGFDHANDEFMMDVAHAIQRFDSVGSNSLTVVVPTHPVCLDLPSSFGWKIQPGWADGVDPINDGQALIEYTGMPYKAVIAYGNGGSGSTVYISFPIACLQDNIREKLIVNSLVWLQQETQRMHHVRVECKDLNLSAAKFYINKTAYQLPANLIISEGSCNFATYPSWSNDTYSYVFDHWEDDNGQIISNNIFFTTTIQNNRTFYACYKESQSPCISVTVSDDGNLTIGQEIELNVTVINNGTCSINDMLIKLIPNSNITVRHDETAQSSIASISPGESSTFTWHITPNEIGTLRLIVTVNGRDVRECPTTCYVRVREDVTK